MSQNWLTQRPDLQRKLQALQQTVSPDEARSTGIGNFIRNADDLYDAVQSAYIFNSSQRGHIRKSLAEKIINMIEDI